MAAGARGIPGAGVSGLVEEVLSSDTEGVLTLPHSIMGNHVLDKGQWPGPITRTHAPKVCLTEFSSSSDHL